MARAGGADTSPWGREFQRVPGPWLSPMSATPHTGRQKGWAWLTRAWLVSVSCPARGPSPYMARRTTGPADNPQLWWRHARRGPGGPPTAAGQGLHSLVGCVAPGAEAGTGRAATQPALPPCRLAQTEAAGACPMGLPGCGPPDNGRWETWGKLPPSRLWAHLAWGTVQP